MEGRLRVELAGVRPRSCGVAFYSSVTGGWLDTGGLDADYWYRNLRQTVLFSDAVGAAVGAGGVAFVEVSAHPVLVPALQEIVDGVGGEFVVVGSLRRGDGGVDRLVRSAAEAFVCGVEVDWGRVLPAGRVVGLPTYPFQHQRYWPANTSRTGDASRWGALTSSHPLLGLGMELAGPGGVVFTARLSLRSHGWLADHAVLGSVLLPGTAFVDLAVCAGDQLGCDVLRELTLQSPLLLPEQGAMVVQVSVAGADERGEHRVSVHARPDTTPEQEWTLHATGILAAEGQVAAEPSPVWSTAGAEQLVDGADVASFYEQRASAGYEYGPAFRGVRGIWRTGDTVLVEVGLPEQPVSGDGFGIHPAVLDAVLHAIGAGGWFPDDVPRLPFVWSGVRLHATGAREVRARITLVGEDAVCLQVTDLVGGPVLSVDALVLRPIRTDSLPSGTSPAGADLYRLQWPEIALPTALLAGEWAVVGGLDPAVVGGKAALRSWNSVAELADAVTSGLTPAPAVTVLALPTAPGPDGVGFVQDVRDAVREWLHRTCWATGRLLVLTRGAIAVDAGDVVENPDTAGAWGLLRSAQQEDASDRILLVDSDSCSLGLLPAAASVAGEPQLALRRHTVRAARLAPADQALKLPTEGEWRLEASERGTLDGLTLAAHPGTDDRLMPGQIRVRTRAVGINFRDVVVSLGLVPHLEGVGIEMSGEVIEVGPDVPGLSVGDRVMGIVAGGAGSVVVTDARLVVPMPNGWSWETAAGVPVVFLTAWYALVELGRVRAGETVLVHAAAGGVGLAAVQIAHRLGARVLGTASEGKWEVVREAGVADGDVFSSRTLDFAQGGLAATQGRGVDVVLNSLTGPFADASLRLAAAGSGGRFVELGKTDLRDPDQVAASYPGVWYRAFDLLALDPELLREMLTRLVDLFDQGLLSPLPITVWDARRTPEALRYVSQARHVGKVVLRMPRPMNPEGTVVLTGGTGTLGAILSRHLVAEYGVRHLLLLGRRGVDAPGARRLVADLTALGAHVDVVSCDVADRTALAAALDGVATEHPVTAVVHAAGVLDDGLLMTLSDAQVRRVLAAKSVAAWHLHELTQDMDLAGFLLFSSAVATFGNAGQGNYAAANAILDALAQQRHLRGLPTVSLGWGLWEQASEMTGGMTDADRTRMARSGLRPLTTDQALALLDQALAAPLPHVLPLPRPVPAVGAPVPSLLRDLIRVRQQRPAAAAAGRGDETSLRGRLTALTPAEQQALLLNLVTTEAATVLGHTTTVNSQRPFKDLGFDSLTSVELRNRLAGATGLSLPPTLVFRYPTPAALAAHLAGELIGETAGDAEADEVDLMTQFGHWESSWSDAELPDELRQQLSQRLRRALLRLDSVDEDGAGVSDSDTEMFAMLDRELGIG
ncbi:NADPH:quinone reductase [Micromonospora matsumotoense]|uniref:NADPH:quinone reductase n=1 Tax=Micromonospora matsumotoense TaxID=121616 RepID=A0A1C5AY12_9ACTN|nr:NADPH:quinone reductase [Micromonospora matsumotoense]